MTYNEFANALDRIKHSRGGNRTKLIEKLQKDCGDEMDWIGLWVDDYEFGESDANFQMGDSHFDTPKDLYTIIKNEKGNKLE